jgi:hypothetical protein
MDSTTIRRLRIEWQTLGAAPASNTAHHRLVTCKPVVEHWEMRSLAELVGARLLPSVRPACHQPWSVCPVTLLNRDLDALLIWDIIHSSIPGVLALASRGFHTVNNKLPFDSRKLS